MSQQMIDFLSSVQCLEALVALEAFRWKPDPKPASGFEHCPKGGVCLTIAIIALFLLIIH